MQLNQSGTKLGGQQCIGHLDIAVAYTCNMLGANAHIHLVRIPPLRRALLAAF